MKPTTRSRYLVIAAPYLLALTAFALFKFFTPDPWMSRDSLDYLNCAFRGDAIWYRPIGYSTFLKSIHSFGGNHNTIVYLQYILSLISSYILLDIAFKLFNPGHLVKICCWLITIFNPLNFYLSNCILPDSIFVSLTAIWVASAIHIVHNEGKAFYIWALVSILCYWMLLSLRFNALYYPLFLVLALLIHKKTILHKFILCVVYIAFTIALINRAKELSVEHVRSDSYAAFGGWALLNNAVHIYNETEVDRYLWDSDEEVLLHDFIVALKDSVPIKKGEVTAEYMWERKGPLKGYVFYQMQHKQGTEYFLEWFGAADLYKRFALELIRNYPMAYIKAFYLPNLKNYLIPNMEMFDFKDSPIPVLKPEQQEYIQYKKQIPPYSELQITTANAIKHFYTLFNILTLIASFFYIIRYVKNFRSANNAIKFVFILACFHIFSIIVLTFAHPVCIRYIAFDQLHISILPILMIAGMVKKYNTKNNSTS